MLGDAAAAEDMIQDLLRSAQELEDVENVARARFALGLLQASKGDTDQALSLLEQSLSSYEVLDDQHLRAMVLSGLGQLLWHHGEHDRAVQATERALRIWRERGDPWGIAIASANLGDMSREADDDDQAVVSYRESLRLYHELEDKGGLADTLVRLAGLAVRHRQPARGAALLGAAQAIRADAGVGVTPASHADTRQPAETARSLLGEAAFDEAWRDGKRSTIAENVSQAARVETRRPARGPRGTSAGTDRVGPAVPLSPRERQVLGLIIDGYADREIADILSISHRTATSHLSSILNKLGVTSRTSAAVYAVRHGVV